MKIAINIALVIAVLLIITLQFVSHPLFTVKRTYVTLSPLQVRLRAIDTQIDKEHSELDNYRSDTPNADLKGPVGQEQQQAYQERISTLQKDRQKIIMQGCAN